MSSYEPVPQRSLDPGRLWAGGVATAVVGALIAVAGILISRGILHIEVLAPMSSGTWGNANTVTAALTAAALGLGATGLMHVLILTTPTPGRFFSWIMGLVTVVAIVLPLRLVAVLDARVATAVISFVTCIAIISLVLGVASSARRPPAMVTRDARGVPTTRPYDRPPYGS